MSDEQKEEVKELTLEEKIEMAQNQLNQVDSSIITIQRLIQSPDGIKIQANEEVKEGEEPLTLNVSGKDMVTAMMAPSLNKLLKDRGSISFDIDRFKSVLANKVE